MTNETEQPYHYFASNVFGWAVAHTRKEAVEAVTRDAGTSTVKRITENARKKGDLGMYAWSCRVLAPKDAHYKINYYAPQGVETDSARHHHITYITQKELAFNTMMGDADWDISPEMDDCPYGEVVQEESENA